jgi:hypothetical protein
VTRVAAVVAAVLLLMLAAPKPARADVTPTGVHPTLGPVVWGKEGVPTTVEPIFVAYSEEEAGSWRIDLAIDAWNASPAVNLLGVLECHPDYHLCLTVHTYRAEGVETRPGWVDSAGVPIPVHAAGWYLPDPARIELNTAAWETSPRDRLAVACHELGHALGLGHHPGQGCMDPYAGDTTAPIWLLPTPEGAPL